MCENRQRQSCKAFTGLTVRAKMICGRPLLPEILGQTDRVGEKSPIFDLFSLVAVLRPLWSEIADFEQIISRSASTVTPSEKNFS